MTDKHTYDDQHKQNHSADNATYSDLSEDDREMNHRRFIRDTAVMESMIAGGLFV